MKENVSYVNASESVRNELAIQYRPLIMKLVRQYSGRVGMPFRSIESMAEEGFVLALNGYDPKRSKMSFKQYAAFAIRNNILNSITREANVVTMNSYNYNDAVSKGSGFISKSITEVSGEHGHEENAYSKEYKFGLYEELEPEDPMGVLVQFIKTNFNERDQDIFFASFCTDVTEHAKLNEMAKKHNVSVWTVSMVRKRIINAIKRNKELKETLANLL